jgi:hypothetical protein
VTFTGGSDVTGFDAVRVGRGMPRAPVPFCGCGGTPHGRGSFCGAYGVRGSAVRARKRGSKTNRCRNKGGGPLFRLCTKGGVGTWWRRNLSGTMSVTWRSAPGGCRRRAPHSGPKSRKPGLRSPKKNSHLGTFYLWNICNNSPRIFQSF